jgi:low temperature requirement protein LtrA
VLSYGLVFFAIWWAWMNFTWFASSYDCDDVPYRLLTLLQIVGVLVLATGIPDAFAGDGFATMTLGYAVMRVPMVAQWLRAAHDNPAVRRETRRYAIGVATLQVLWLLRLLLPASLGTTSFLVLAVGEMAVPLWAEWSPGEGTATPWHAGHIVERYGLFTLIVLGECILAVTVAIEPVVTAHGVSLELLAIAGGGIAIAFSTWWIYFRQEAAELLHATPLSSFIWGYGHLGVFAAIAAIGTGLQLAVEHARHVTHLGTTGTGLAVAVPVAVVLALVGEFQSNPHTGLATHRLPFGAAVLAIVALGASAGRLGVAGAVVGIGLVAVALTVAIGVLETRVAARTAAST